MLQFIYQPRKKIERERDKRKESARKQYVLEHIDIGNLDIKEIKKIKKTKEREKERKHIYRCR
jgi:hypothetical protein